MDKYEVTYLVADESVLQKDPIASLVKELGGAVVSTKRWGQKPLAYSIKKQSTAFYVTLVVEMPADKLKKFNRALQINQDILRALIVKGIYEMKITERDEQRGAQRRPPAIKTAPVRLAAQSEPRRAVKTPVEDEAKAASVAKKTVAQPAVTQKTPKPAAKPKDKPPISDEERLAQLEGKLKDLLKS